MTLKKGLIKMASELVLAPVIDRAALKKSEKKL